MNFDDVQSTDSMYTVAVDVADDIREYVGGLFAQQHARNLETDGAMANVVLTGLTLVWLEAVHGHWNTVASESAISLLRGLKPEDRETGKEMRRAARDFLRRSGWWIKGSK